MYVYKYVPMRCAHMFYVYVQYIFMYIYINIHTHNYMYVCLHTQRRAIVEFRRYTQNTKTILFLREVDKTRVGDGRQRQRGEGPHESIFKVAGP